MKNENFLFELPNGKFIFSGPSVPVSLTGEPHRPRFFNSLASAVSEATIAEFENYERRGRVKVTLYMNSEFMGNIFKIEGTIAQFGFQKYAQYDNGVFVHLIPNRKRNGRMWQRQSHATVVMLEGHGHPEPDAVFTVKLPSLPGIEVSTSKYSSFDEGWVNDFDRMIDAYIAEKNPVVMLDARASKGYNAYDRHRNNKVAANV